MSEYREGPSPEAPAQDPPAQKRKPGRPAKPGGKNSNVRLGAADLEALKSCAAILGVTPGEPGWESRTLRGLVWYSLARMKRRNLRGPVAGLLAVVPQTGAGPLAVLDAHLSAHQAGPAVVSPPG